MVANVIKCLNQRSRIIENKIASKSVDRNVVSYYNLHVTNGTKSPPRLVHPKLIRFHPQVRIPHGFNYKNDSMQIEQEMR